MAKEFAKTKRPLMGVLHYKMAQASAPSLAAPHRSIALSRSFSRSLATRESEGLVITVTSGDDNDEEDDDDDGMMGNVGLWL